MKLIRRPEDRHSPCRVNRSAIMVFQMTRDSQLEITVSNNISKYFFWPSYGVSQKCCFVWIVLLLMSFPTQGNGQMELGYGDLLYPDRLMFASTKKPPSNDPLREIRAMITRVIITAEDRNQQRFFTVFRASRHGHVEFGFPMPHARPTGSLEIFDATEMSSLCCPPGIRMVAVRHVCSDSYLTVDSFGELRACQLSDTGRVAPLRMHTHCIDGEKMHTCTESPYFYLDALSKIRSGEASTTKLGLKRYKIRFERKTSTSRIKQVFYADVVGSAWQVRLRTQNSVLRRATIEAAKKLWTRSLHVLFRRTINSYKMRRKKRNFWPQKSLCNVDPSVVRDFIINNITLTQFTDAIESTWRSEPLVAALASTIAWSQMKSTHKDVFVVITVKTVKNFLRNALMRVTELHCLINTQWGRLSNENKLKHLEKSLTISWIQRRSEARQLVISAMEKTIDSKLTTFLIQENG
ncbi:uncharacterized protein LOC120346089 [Styela clava]